MKNILLILFATIFGITNAQKFQWAKSMGATYQDKGNSIAVDNLGNVYSAGIFRDTVDFDPGPGVFNLISGSVYNNYIQKLDNSGNFVWAKQIGRSVNPGVCGITIDASGNVYTIGDFRGTADFDPGIGTFNLISSSGNTDVFISKLDNNGDFVWAKKMGGAAFDAGRSIVTDSLGNIYTTGSFGYTVDFDPGAGTFNLNSAGGGDIFISKLDNNGNFVWAKKMGGIDGEAGFGIDLDPSGNIYTTGTFRDTADFDPGAGTFNLISGGGYDIFISKLDNNGNFVWAKQTGGAGEDQGLSIVVDALNNIITTGFFNSTVDFDPGAGVLNLTSPSNGNNNAYVQKLDASGNFMWATKMGTVSVGHGIDVDKAGNIYTTGDFTGIADFDPGAGIFNLNSNNGYAVFIQKLSPLGNFIWAGQMSGVSAVSSGQSIKISDSYNIYTLGYFNNTMDCNPEGNDSNLISNGWDDAFVVKWSQDSCSNMALVIDSVADMTCTSLTGFASSFVTGGMEPYAYSWDLNPPNSNPIAIFDNAGIYQLTVSDSLGCIRTSSVLINGPDTNWTSSFDLNLNLVSTNFRTGFPATVWLDAFNDGCTPVSGQLSLVLSNLVNYNSASPLPDAINGDTLVWNFSNITYDSAHITPQVFLTVPAIVSFGNQVCFETMITPIAGDDDTINNVKQYCFTVINAYAPNDKQVYPKGECNAGYILNNQLLTYTVRFQNTGNADAINIYVLDSLDTDLDLNTIRVIGKSHEPLITEVLPDNVLKFRFDNIFLPDSTSNEPESHGYIIFEVLPKSGLSSGTLIKNTVGIYFDFNPPVYTNVVSNVVVNSIPIINTSVVQSNNTLTANLSNVGYQWVDCNNGFTPINGETNQSFTAYTNGNYAVMISENGCMDTSACFNVFTVDVTDNSFNSTISFFPNPTTGLFTIQSSIKISSIEIVNVLGEKIYFSQVNSNKSEIDLSKQPSGCYFIRFERENKIFAIDKLIITE